MNRWVLVSVLCLAAVVSGRRLRDEEDLDDMMFRDAGTDVDIVLNFDPDCEEMTNALIQLQTESVFQYIAIATFFRRYNVDIIGLSLMYNAKARQKLNIAKDLMMYLVKRGAQIVYNDIPKPTQVQWADPAEALKKSLAMEKEIAGKVNDLAKHAAGKNDPHLVAFLEGTLVNEQTDNIFEVASLINKLKKGGSKFGVMAINQQLVKKYKDFVDCKSDTEKYKWNY